MKRTQNGLLMITALLLPTLFWSGMAQAVPIAYDIDYLPWATGFNGNSGLKVTVYLDSASITGAAQEDIVLTGVDVTFIGPAFPGDPFYSYSNTDTSACEAPLCSGNHVPFTAEFINNNFTGYLKGVQSGPGQSPFFIRGLSFGNQAQGHNARIMFYGAHPDRANTQVDIALQGFISGPRTITTSVPEPATICLLALGLAGVAGCSRRRRRRDRVVSVPVRAGV